MHDDELLRYSRHILLAEVGIEGQQRLLDAHLLIVGAGGLGCAAALYLGAAGVGHMTLVDDDVVDLTNLQRQIGHATDRIGMRKVHSLARAIEAVNSGVEVRALAARADAALLRTEVACADVVLDCSDNFATRHAVNAACVEFARPLVSGAALRFDGQIAIFDSRLPLAPCYACVFPPADAPREEACATMGVLGPLVGIVGASQAADALALILGQAEARTGRLRMLDAHTMQWTDMRVRRDPACQICGSAMGLAQSRRAP